MKSKPQIRQEKLNILRNRINQNKSNSGSEARSPYHYLQKAVLSWVAVAIGSLSLVANFADLYAFSQIIRSLLKNWNAFEIAFWKAIVDPILNLFGFEAPDKFFGLLTYLAICLVLFFQNYIKKKRPKRFVDWYYSKRVLGNVEGVNFGFFLAFILSGPIVYYYILVKIFATPFEAVGILYVIITPIFATCIYSVIYLSTNSIKWVIEKFTSFKVKNKKNWIKSVFVLSQVIGMLSMSTEIIKDIDNFVINFSSLIEVIAIVVTSLLMFFVLLRNSFGFVKIFLGIAILLLLDLFFFAFESGITSAQ